MDIFCVDPASLTSFSISSSVREPTRPCLSSQTWWSQAKDPSLFSLFFHLCLAFPNSTMAGSHSKRCLSSGKRSQFCQPLHQISLPNLPIHSFHQHGCSSPLHGNCYSREIQPATSHPPWIHLPRCGAATQPTTQLETYNALLFVFHRFMLLVRHSDHEFGWSESQDLINVH